MTKHPTRQELEVKLRLWKDLFWIFLACCLLLLTYFGFLISQREDYFKSVQSENEMLKEQIGKDVWTLEVNCSQFGVVKNAYYRLDFENYSEYLSSKRVIDNENCEVIE